MSIYHSLKAPYSLSSSKFSEYFHFHVQVNLFNQLQRLRGPKRENLEVLHGQSLHRFSSRKEVTSICLGCKIEMNFTEYQFFKFFVTKYSKENYRNHARSSRIVKSSVIVFATLTSAHLQAARAMRTFLKLERFSKCEFFSLPMSKIN